MQRRPAAKQLLKAQERFRAALTEFVISKGARPSTFYDYELDTSAGLLQISVYGSWIATRFEDVALGRRFSGSCGCPCNPYSGKWNFHFCDGTIASLEPKVAIAQFGFYLDRLLAWQPAAVGHGDGR